MFPLRTLVLTPWILGMASLPLLAGPIITEFMASGSDAPADSRGETPDWIEIHNPDATPLDLAGHALTDDQEVLMKWVFPAGVTLEPGGYLIVFASGDESVTAAGEWHTNFQLDGGGEYLALVTPDSEVLSEFSYPEQFGNVSYGIFGEQRHFFREPTPGASNEEGVLGFVADTKFSVNRGFFGEAFDLEITSATEGAEIFYSLNGSDPATGTIFSPAKKYTGPLRIETTAVVRAVAKKNGWQRTNTDTHTYIFPADVVSQPRNPEGFPDKWGRFNVDYEMDPDITGPNADQMLDALRSLPTVSFVGKVDDFFGSNGIYANPESRGVEFERPISFEWIEPDGTSKFQVNCGARIQGGYFRQASATEKHSFRLLFKDEYGVGRLRENIINLPGAASNFDTIVFRAGANDGYAWGDAGTTVQFTRDEFGRRLAWDAGHFSPRGGFQHLYVNGLYWGLYNLTERPNEDFSSTYYGGDSEDWDSVNSGEVKNAGGRESGSDPSNDGLRDWRAYETAARAAETYADYMALQGLNPDGTRNPQFKVYLDADHYADYMIINFWGGNWDWPNKNFWFGRLNTPESTGFKHYVWDFENTMGNNRGRSPLNMNAPRNTDWVGRPYDGLRDLLWFQIKWADRTQRMFFNDGVLTPESLGARYQAMADEIEPAIYAETARWGDDNASRPHTIDEWRGERDWMLNTYLPQRTGIVLEQFKDKDLYPAKAAPVLSQHGGTVSAGFELTFEGSTANLYYTTDGSDPYHFTPTGAIEISETASPYEGPVRIDGTTTVKARYHSRSIFGAVTWSALTEAVFTVGTDGLIVTELMYHPTTPTDEERGRGWTSASQFEYLIVTNMGGGRADLSGVSFAAGIDFAFSDGSIASLEPGERVIVVRDRMAFESRYGTGHPVAGEYGGRLDDGGETVRLVDGAGKVIHAFRYDDEDSEGWPAEADGGGSALVLADAPSRPDSSKAESWMAGPPLQGDPPSGGAGFSDWLATHSLGQAEGDEDGDGVVNVFEYVYGSDPREASHDAGPVMVLESESVPSFRYTKRANLSGVSLRVEGSADLRTWETVSGPAWSLEDVPAGEKVNAVVRLVDPSATSVQYLRLTVTVTAP